MKYARMNMLASNGAITSGGVIINGGTTITCILLTSVIE